MTDPLNALRRSSGKSSSGLKPERAAPSVHSAARRRVGSVAVNVARDANGAVPQQVSHGLDVHAAFQPATATECRSVCTATPPTPAVSAATSTTRSRFRVTSPLKKRADTEQPITLYPGLWTGRPVRAGVDDGRQHGRHIRPTSWTTRSRLRASRRTGRVAAVRPRRPRGCMTGYMAPMTV
jgi:hypothetical protein